jgi:aldehyde dehydrogenase (NAD+)
MTDQDFNSEPRMLIGGQLRSARSGATFDVVNPATGRTFAQVADAAEVDMDLAITAARAAFDEGTWANDRELRKHVLRQLKDAIAAEVDSWRPELVAEVGTPVMLTYGFQLDAPALESLEWAIGMIDTFEWERSVGDVDTYAGPSHGLIIKEPIGVVGAIVPWNFPVEVTMSKLAPALAAGNTVVLKAAPDTPLNATRLGRLVAEHTDMPAGVLNVITSHDHLLGELLVTDRRVDAITFTGSTATGRRIMAAGAPTLKRLFLELGGKSALVMLDDAALPGVVQTAAGLCAHAGQGCSMTSRLLVPRGLYGEVVELLEHAFRTFPYGDPTDPSIMMGPVISEKQRQRILGYIGKGVSDGARLVVGGAIPDHLTEGFFLEPTLFADVDNRSTIAQEEIFGPVLSVIPYDGDDDAVRLANDSDYGLSGGVLSADNDRGLAFARRIRTGTMSVNGGTYFRRDLPFGGYKSSGLGRQNAREGFESMLETKSVGIAGPAHIPNNKDGITS